MAKKKGKEEATKADQDAKTQAPKREGYSGARLASLREKAGMTIADLSQRTKISKAVLQALEAERYGDMPNARVYVRGFVRCVAYELELDLDQVSKSYLPGWEKWARETPGTHY